MTQDPIPPDGAPVPPAAFAPPEPPRAEPPPIPARPPLAVLPARRRRRRGPLLVALAGLAAIAVAAALLVPRALREDEAAAPAPAPSSSATSTVLNAGNGGAQVDYTGKNILAGMNAALAAGDRDGFLALASGDAVAPLARWWDNMQVLGATGGVASWVSPWGKHVPVQPDGTARMEIFLGAITAGSPTVAAGDHRFAGRTISATRGYVATVAVTDTDTATITHWEPLNEPAPWDVDDLYAVAGPNGVLAGAVAERALVDEIAPTAQAAAEWIVKDFSTGGSPALVDRFLTFVTDDPARFNTWLMTEDPTLEWEADRSGTAFALAVPNPYPGQADGLATAPDRALYYAGSVLTLGPSGLHDEEDPGWTTDVLVHEFAHAMAQVAAPAGGSGDYNLTEGFATWVELRALDGSFAPAGSYSRDAVEYCVDEAYFQDRLPDVEMFAADDSAWCAYILAGSAFAYLDSLGADPREMVRLGYENLGDLRWAADAVGVPFDDAAWAAWVRSL